MKVIEYINKTKNHIKIYLVECVKCGKRKLIQYSRLNSLATCFHSNKHCGVYLKEYDDNINLTINDYTIIRFIKSSKQGLRYMAKCNVCGTEFDTLISNFKRGYGTKHKDCTCHLPKSKHLNRFRKIYSCMRYRTTNPNYNEYHLYGGRGISSDYFSDFITFYKTMFDSYIQHVERYGEKNTTIERVNVNGDYTLDNCCWASIKEQANNRRNSLKFTYKSISKTLPEWCNLLNLNYSVIYHRIVNLGLSFECATNIEELPMFKELCLSNKGE